MKMFKTLMCLALVFALSAAVIYPATFGGDGRFPVTSVLHSDKACLASATDSEEETSAHEQLYKTALSIENLNVQSGEENDFFCETEADSIEELSDSVGFVCDEILLMFEGGVPFFKKMAVINEIGGTVVGYTAIINKYQIKISSRSFDELTALCEKLTARDEIALACCNMAFMTSYAEIPDDPWTYNGQPVSDGWDESNPSGANWWLEATQTLSAWDYNEYFNEINVGIVDGGFETSHEDLVGKISFPKKWQERQNRPNSHGTHVAGIISANAGNGVGIAGICNKAKLLCSDWSYDDGQLWATSERIVTGFIALVKSGAKVINFSLGSSGSFNPKLEFFWNIGMEIEARFMSYIVASLLSRGYDFVVVQSAGNGNEEGNPCDAYYNATFASISEDNAFTGLTGISKQDVLDRIIVVASITQAHTDNSFYMSSFSNFGDTVDIAAPGSLVLSCDIYDDRPYSYKSGTSMAAPVVTGIAALVWSVNPSFSGAQVRNIICDESNTKYTAVQYYDDELPAYTFPVVNAKLSVEAALRLSGLPEDETTEAVTENETGAEETVSEPVPQSEVLLSDSTPEEIEKYRGEIGE